MSFTALIIQDERQRKKLIDAVANEVFDVGRTWPEDICHHMTINMGGYNEKKAGGFIEGQYAEMCVVRIGWNDAVVAVEVESPVPSCNEKPWKYKEQVTNGKKHITVALNRKHGTPVNSNLIKNWQDFRFENDKGEEIMISGYVAVCK